jgi:hypothetical protein
MPPTLVRFAFATCVFIARRQARWNIQRLTHQLAQQGLPNVRWWNATDARAGLFCEGAVKKGGVTFRYCCVCYRYTICCRPAAPAPTPTHATSEHDMDNILPGRNIKQNGRSAFCCYCIGLRSSIRRKRRAQHTAQQTPRSTLHNKD